MDFEARQMHRRAVAVATAAAVVVLGQHAVSRPSTDALSTDRPLAGSAGLAGRTHAAAWESSRGDEGFDGRPVFHVKPAAQCPSGGRAATPQLAQWDGKLSQD
jgi:hypothetical protein